MGYIGVTPFAIVNTGMTLKLRVVLKFEDVLAMFEPRWGGINGGGHFFLCYGVKAHNIIFYGPQLRVAHFAVIIVNSPLALA